MAVTAEQQKQLATLARRANRRIERASKGQQKALEYYTRKYHTRQREGGTYVFKQGKAKSESEYYARMRELQRFLNAPSTTRAGWEQIKKENVKKAGKTIRGDGYTISDRELAMILEELPPKAGSAEFYAALANVEIAKQEREQQEIASSEDIKAAIESRRSDQQRTEALLQLRKRAKTR